MTIRAELLLNFLRAIFFTVALALSATPICGKENTHADTKSPNTLEKKGSSATKTGGSTTSHTASSGSEEKSKANAISKLAKQKTPISSGKVSHKGKPDSDGEKTKGKEGHANRHEGEAKHKDKQKESKSKNEDEGKQEKNKKESKMKSESKEKGESTDKEKEDVASDKKGKSGERTTRNKTDQNVKETRGSDEKTKNRDKQLTKGDNKGMEKRRSREKSRESCSMVRDDKLILSVIQQQPIDVSQIPPDILDKLNKTQADDNVCIETPKTNQIVLAFKPDDTLPTAPIVDTAPTAPMSEQPVMLTQKYEVSVNDIPLEKTQQKALTSMQTALPGKIIERALRDDDTQLMYRPTKPGGYVTVVAGEKKPIIVAQSKKPIETKSNPEKPKDETKDAIPAAEQAVSSPNP